MTYEVGDIVRLKKTASLRQLRVGDPESGGGFPAEMHRLRPSDYDPQKTGGKKYQRTAQKRAKLTFKYIYGMINVRDIQ